MMYDVVKGSFIFPTAVLALISYHQPCLHGFFKRWKVAEISVGDSQRDGLSLLVKVFNSLVSCVMSLNDGLRTNIVAFPLDSFER
jgi:hypothetical protein